MKMIKVLVIIAILLVVVVVVAMLGMDYAAKQGIEAGATKALGVDTAVESVSIRMLRSNVAMEGLRISNPEGYESSRLMALDSGSVTCNVPSLLTNEVQIDEIILDSPELTIELKPGLPPRSNLGDVLDNLKSGKPSPEEKERQKQFKIDLIRITNTKVRFHELEGRAAEVVLPDIELKDVRNPDGSPVVFADVMGQILASMGTSALEHAGGVTPREFRTALGKTLSSAEDLIARAPESLPEGALEGIFGGKKEK